MYTFVSYMGDNDKTHAQPTTTWHPMLVVVVELLAPRDLKVMPEFPLNRLPLRVDIVVLQMVRQPAPGLTRKLRSIFDHLRKHTLIEFKGPTDDLEQADVTTLLAYAGQYMTMHKVFEPEDMCLMVIADRIPDAFVEQVKRFRGVFSPAENGLWRGHLAGLPLRGVELRVAYKTGPSERALYMFTKAFLTDPRAMLREAKEVDGEDLHLYRTLYQHVQQFRKDRSQMERKDLDLGNQSFVAALKELLAVMEPEDRLDGLTPEQRLAGLKPEQRLAGLKPEQRLAGLKPEQILAALPPETLEYIARKLKS
jgi:hypothetical protein